MFHRHLNSDQWTPMTIDSLFDRGEMPDWQEFGTALANDAELALTTLNVAQRHEDRGSAALARILIKRFHPQIDVDQKEGDLQIDLKLQTF